MKLYYLFQYDRSLKVRWLAKEVGLSLEQVQLDAYKGEHLQAPFNQVNPFGLIPTVEQDNKEILFEAGSICLQICREHSPELLDESNIRFMQWLFYFTSTLDQIAGGIIGLRVFGESAEVRQKLERRLPIQLPALEKHLSDKQFWYQDKFTLLDIFAWQNLAYLYVDGQLTHYPNLKRYVEVLAERPALRSFEPEKLLKPS